MARKASALRATVTVEIPGSVSGSAYIFRFDGTSWSQEAKLTASDGAAGDQFGQSVSISGGAAVIGALFDGDALTHTWVQTGGPAVTLSDPTSASPTFMAPSVVGVFSETLTFELTVDDGFGGSATDDVVVTVLDTNAPPACELAQPSEARLWPPNHKMRQITIVGVSDPDDGDVMITILDVTQDEPITGLGDGDTSPDAVIQEGSVLLRSERQGGGNGRVYRITFEADDGVGGVCTGTVTVCVPHDKRGGADCIDDGQNHSSLAP